MLLLCSLIECDDDNKWGNFKSANSTMYDGIKIFVVNYFVKYFQVKRLISCEIVLRFKLEVLSRTF